MLFYTCFDWLKKLRLFVNEQNLKIGVVLKASRAVVIGWFSLNEATLGLFKFISNYLPYFEQINIFFNIIPKKVCTTWLRLFLHEPNTYCDQSLIVKYGKLGTLGQYSTDMIHQIIYISELQFLNNVIDSTVICNTNLWPML